MSNHCKRRLSTTLISATALVTTVLPANAETWTFITPAKDDGLWFAGRVRHVGDQAVVHVKVTDDPDDGDYTYFQAFNCKKRLIKQSSGKWEPIEKNTIASEFFTHACEGKATNNKSKSALKGELSDTPFQF